MNVSIDSALLNPQSFDSRWKKGPFLAFKMQHPKQKGTNGEKIAKSIIGQKFPKSKISRSRNAEADVCVDMKRCEIKTSTVSQGTDNGFSFLQIRPGDDYDFLIFQCFFFDGNIVFYKIPKNDVISLIESGIFKPQHRGDRGQKETFAYIGTIETFKSFLWFEVKYEETHQPVS